MGNKTRIVFFAGLICFTICLTFKPILLVLFGKKAKGEVVIVNQVRTGGSSIHASVVFNHPVVQFSIGENCPVVFESDLDAESEILYGRRVDVLYLKSHPHFAVINSFHCLFDGTIIRMVVFLMVWVGFFTSFRYIFDKIKN
jgi:hypothetical protein